MTQKQTRKILRIGIIQAGKIIEERLLRKREPVTVGESHKNTFVIPATGLPLRFPLFELKGDKYFLTIADWMDGRLSLGTGVADLKSLKQQKIAQKVGQVDYKNPNQASAAKKKVPVYRVPLSEKSRGKLTFGEVTLLFQFVTPPPVPVKPQLPAIIQGGWIKSIDWVYSTILFMSLIAHMAFVYWCRVTGPLPEVTMDMIPARFAKFIQVQKPPERRKPKVQKKGDDKKGKDKKGKKKKKKAGKKKAVKKKAGKPKPRKSAAQLARERAERRRKISNRLARSGILALLGSKSKGGGSVSDVLKGGGLMEKNLDEALKGVKGVAVAGGAGARGSRRGGGARGTIEGGSSKLSGPSGKAGTGGAGGKKRGGVRVKSKLAIESLETEGTLNQSKLRKLISRKRRTVQYCYERELKRTPSLSGKITVRITIALTGRVSNVEIDDNSLNSRVARCITRKVKRWRFPKPEGEAATVAIPFVFSSS